MMLIRTGLFAVAAAVAWAGGTLAAPYAVDPDHTAITFTASHLGFSLVHGRFERFAATIDFDPEAIEATQVRIELDPGSVDTGSKTRDVHLRTYPDLFDVGQFPTITFVSTAVELTSAETARMTGDLTLRGVTRPVTFDVRLNARGVTPLSQGREVVGLTATAEIDRTQFGMGFAAPAVSAVIPVRIDLEMSPVE